mmetsp:Transcript_5718/g.15158  ORF Transcript_5718/g.15158 Transcript_5718/m.15158 type:complete len:113 (+) Transcript_5718:158-496(+)
MQSAHVRSPVLAEGGVILEPTSVAQCLRGSFAADGGTWDKGQNPAHMGAPGFGRGAVWCKPEWGAGDPWCGGNPFAPENLQLMLQGHRGRDQINEVCASSTSSAMRHRGGAV